MKIGIIGGGIMGVSLAYFLTKQGAQVEVFEGSPILGGLAGPTVLADGTIVDRYYHTILTSDAHLRQLCSELGISDHLRFHTTKTGFYYNGSIYSMNNMIEFLKFPPLGWVDRFRLGLTVLYSQFIRDWKKLEAISVEKWLVGISGRRTYENIWRPLLRAKFDGGFETTPATYIWSRLVRMKSTRSGANQSEQAGHLIGGYFTLLKAMAERIESAGGQLHLNCAVQEIITEQGKATGLRTEDGLFAFDAMIGTVQTPLFQQLIPSVSQDYKDALQKNEYLGVIAVLLVLDRPLTGYWTLNITDDRSPFTGVIETTAYIDPQYTGGYHLAYLPKYTTPGSDWQKQSDEEIINTWLAYLREMLPQFDPIWIRQILVHREHFVEPLHYLNQTSLIPPVETPIQNLFLVTTAQIYPALTNGEAIARHARTTAELILQADPK